MFFQWFDAYAIELEVARGSINPLCLAIFSQIATLMPTHFLEGRISHEGHLRSCSVGRGGERGGGRSHFAHAHPSAYLRQTHRHEGAADAGRHRSGGGSAPERGPGGCA